MSLTETVGRKLNLQFEPALVMREAVVMAQFTNMVNKRAKTPAETKALLVELDEQQSGSKRLHARG